MIIDGYSEAKSRTQTGFSCITGSTHKQSVQKSTETHVDTDASTNANHYSNGNG